MGHWLSPSGVLLALIAVLGYLPAIFGTLAAIAGLIWYVVQILQSEWWKGRKALKRAKRVAKLKARLAQLGS